MELSFVYLGNRDEFYKFLRDVMEEYFSVDDPYEQNIKSLINWAQRQKFNKRDRNRKKAIEALVNTIDMAFHDTGNDIIGIFVEWIYEYTSLDSWDGHDMFSLFKVVARREGWSV